MSTNRNMTANKRVLALIAIASLVSTVAVLAFALQAKSADAVLPRKVVYCKDEPNKGTVNGKRLCAPSYDPTQYSGLYIIGTKVGDTVNPSGDDLIKGAEGSDAIYSGPTSSASGLDEIWGQTGADYLYGYDGADVLYGWNTSHPSDSDSAVDRLDGGSGTDTCHGHSEDTKVSCP